MTGDDPSLCVCEFQKYPRDHLFKRYFQITLPFIVQKYRADRYYE